MSSVAVKHLYVAMSKHLEASSGFDGFNFPSQYEEIRHDEAWSANLAVTALLSGMENDASYSTIKVIRRDSETKRKDG